MRVFVRFPDTAGAPDPALAILAADGWRVGRGAPPIVALLLEHFPGTGPAGAYEPYPLLACAERAAAALGGVVVETDPPMSALALELPEGAIA